MIEKCITYYSCVSCYKNEALFEHHLSLINEKRREKVLRYKFEKDRYLSLGVYILFMHVLETNNINLEELEIKENKFGKPFIANSNLYFNFSHSGFYVLVSISNKEVGCDIEEIREVDINIARQFHPKEYLDIKNDNGKFYKYWTIKESYVKYLGIGISKGLSFFNVDLSSNKINNALFLEGKINNDYQFAVVSEANIETPICVDISKL